MKTGTLRGDSWKGLKGDEKLENETSPFSNLLYNIDTRTIEGDARDYELRFKVPNLWNYGKTKKNKDSIFEAVFNNDKYFYKILNMWKGGVGIYQCACNFYLGTK